MLKQFLMKKAPKVVKKVKGYKPGGFVTDTNIDVANTGTDLASGGLGLAGANIQSKNMPDEQGFVNVNQSKKAGALQGGAAGLKMGATVGLNPALLAATGGLSALAVPVAGGIGAAIGAVKSKKNAIQQNLLNQNSLDEQKVISRNNTQRSALAQAMAERETDGYSDGGKIKGKGTGKSDSIKAEIKEGSFIVPAENAEVAEVIRKKVLKAPVKKANLSQKGGVDVKVSNGEHSFTEKEAEKIESVLGEEVLEKLAPEAEEDGDSMEYAKGTPKDGVVDTKKEKAAIDKVNREREVNKKNREESASKTKKDQKQKDIESARQDKQIALYEKQTKELNKAKAEHESAKDSYNLYKSQSETALKQPKRPGGLGSFTKPGEYEVNDKREELLNNVTEKENKLKSLLTKQTPSKADFLTDNGLSGNAESNPVSDGMVNNPPVSTTNKRAPVVKRKDISESLTTKDAFSKDYASMEDVPPTEPTSALARSVNADVESDLSKSARQAESDLTQATTPVASSEGKYDGLSSILSQAASYGIPIAQTAIGLNALNKSGKRPINTIDADYLSSLDKANAATTIANNNAKFGFTPEEQALLTQQNQGLTNAGVYAARNLSGGSAGAALSNTRSALADSFGRDLQTKVQNRNLMLQKQDVANERQRYADTLVKGKTALLNNIFDQKLAGWQQNQSAGSALVGAGLSNLSETARYNDFTRKQKANQ